MAKFAKRPNSRQAVLNLSKISGDGELAAKHGGGVALAGVTINAQIKRCLAGLDNRTRIIQPVLAPFPKL